MKDEDILKEWMKDYESLLKDWENLEKKGFF
jgi:hypothetical protein